MTFQSQFKDIVDFNPMEHCITITSACNVAYRKKWMPENKIAVRPVRGWLSHHIQSCAALTWLYWEEKKLIKTNLLPRNKGERTLMHGSQRFLVDGYDE